MDGEHRESQEHQVKLEDLEGSLDNKTEYENIKDKEQSEKEDQSHSESNSQTNEMNIFKLRDGEVVQNEIDEKLNSLEHQVQRLEI